MRYGTTYGHGNHPPSPRKTSTAAASEHERRCLVTGEMRPKEDLVRFVVSPDNDIVPDLAANLPGRGLWVTATREAIETAARKNLFSKAAKAKVTVDPDLADTVTRLLRKRCLDWLGLARSAGIAILSQPQVESALKSGIVDLLFVADDAAANGLEKINSASISTTRCFTRDELGLALGHEQIVYAGLKNHRSYTKIARRASPSGKDRSYAPFILGNG